MRTITVQVDDRDVDLVPLRVTATVVVACPRAALGAVRAIVDGRLRAVVAAQPLARTSRDRAGVAAALEAALAPAFAAMGAQAVAVAIGAVDDPTGLLAHGAGVTHAQASATGRIGVARVWAAAAEQESLAVQRIWSAWRAAQLTRIEAEGRVAAAEAVAALAPALAIARARAAADAPRPTHREHRTSRRRLGCQAVADAP